MNKDEVMLRSTLTGLFCGVIATLACLIFDAIFRTFTRFPISGLVNVTTIIISCVVFLLLIGGAFNLFSYLKGGKIIFSVLFFLITCLSVWGIMGVNFISNPIMNEQYRWLISGIIIIMGFCSFFLIPFLFTNKWFEEHVV